MRTAQFLQKKLGPAIYLPCTEAGNNVLPCRLIRAQPSILKTGNNNFFRKRAYICLNQIHAWAIMEFANSGPTRREHGQNF
jgi:hypothetical protein